ncbi:phytanoyl-CoA dioxygenase family protein [Streptomyces sp. NPDC048484]|uniref:phytanoyl-CoA dioxygenase family protein n=1 Tax=Streptomyces sp. NPDC048484 TaxID=3155146 RepID=UPI00342C973D
MDAPHDARDDAGRFVLTRAEAQLLPSAEDVRSYEEHGWYLSKKLFTEDEVDTILAASEKFYGGYRDQLLPSHPPTLAYWAPGTGDVLRHNDYIHYEVDAIREILTKPLIGAVAALLAGADLIRVFQATLIYKPPQAGDETYEVPWHFDRNYWATSTSERMLTAFVPLHDCDERIGTISMVDGSHRWRETGAADEGTLHFAARDRDGLDDLLARNAAYNGDEVRKVPMIIPKGHVSFHHCRTYHGSGPNHADAPRRAISLHLQDGDNRWRPYRLDDGSLLAYNHDLLVRRDAAGEPDYTDPHFCPVIWQETHQRGR